MRLCCSCRLSSSCSGKKDFWVGREGEVVNWECNPKGGCPPFICKRTWKQHQPKFFMPFWFLGTRGIFCFDRIPKNHSVCDLCIVDQQMEQLMLPLLIEGRKSSPSASQHWCPCNLQVIKVVVHTFAALAVLLLWAVLHWCAFIFLNFECKQSPNSRSFHLCSLWHFFDLCVCCLYEACPLLHILASKWCSSLPSCGSILCAELRVLSCIAGAFRCVSPRRYVILWCSVLIQNGISNGTPNGVLLMTLLGTILLSVHTATEVLE